MASKGKILRNELKMKKIKRFSTKRMELKEIISRRVTSDMSDEDRDKLMKEKMEAQSKLDGLPKDSSKVRFRNRCYMTGRPRGYYRHFCISRCALREMALQGFLPGVEKSSW